MLVGVISDTHGKFHPAIPSHFAGVELILHAGDIGQRAVMDQLEALAPVLAVTGNVDWGKPLDRLYPRVQQIELEQQRVYMTHIGGRPQELRGRLPEPKPAVYICGHSHIALLERDDNVLFLNPGSAGAPRFGRKPSLARMTITPAQISAELIWL